jgi:hypothetical protein
LCVSATLIRVAAADKAASGAGSADSDHKQSGSHEGAALRRADLHPSRFGSSRPSAGDRAMAWAIPQVSPTQKTKKASHRCEA